ncbi:hypothetical protein LPJ73_004539 [Coemansia sp. RSA 2703]|nr:hypothetical protein LPJ73_004539 [Coemansia sp. RSA 2703]
MPPFSLPLATRPHIRHASVLSPAHAQRQRPQDRASLAQQLQHLQRLRTPARPRVFAYRHSGPAPPSPQVLRPLEYILQERPLDGLTPANLPQKMSAGLSHQKVQEEMEVSGRVSQRGLWTVAAVGVAAGALGATAVTLLVE